MTTKKQRSLLLNFNRAFIYCFALLGLFYDYTWAYVLSLTLWVWLSVFIFYEYKIIKSYQTYLTKHPFKYSFYKK